MGAKTSSLMAHINDLNDRGDYEGIIKFIEALTPEEQTSDMVSQLARAYNNLAQAGETQPLEKALQLLDSIEPDERNNHYWHFRRAYSLYYLDRVTESRKCVIFRVQGKFIEGAEQFSPLLFLKLD